jgi:hypothetical protein
VVPGPGGENEVVILPQARVSKPLFGLALLTGSA